ncbi:hypothetical protein [Glycomyces sp. NPDC048151]|uniref:hypothetical protein n=1 Tax=Glycomyces sp. NPDC048151 TaxID=3364002 RepID=UPI003721E4E4
MARRQADRPETPGLRKRRLGVVAVVVPLVVLLAAAVTVAQDVVADDPNFRRMAVTSDGAVFDILGQLEPLGTGGLAGEVDLARHPGETAITTANLVLGTKDDETGPFGKAAVSIRSLNSTTYEYNPDAESIVFTSGLEFEVEHVPGMAGNGQPLYLYTGPVRLLPDEPVADPAFPPLDRTFSLPSPVMVWEGANGVTGAESIGMLNDFHLTVGHPA